MKNSRRKKPQPDSVNKELEIFRNSKERIRKFKKEAAVVFIDMVGSVAYKNLHDEDPETWMCRVLEFYEFMRDRVQSAGGAVVRYFGDEVLAVFEGRSAVANAMKLISQVESVEKELTKKVQDSTRLKVAADKGLVYYLSVKGHEAPEPQGIMVDRCARIAKQAEEGTVLCSSQFKDACANPLDWKRVGTIPLKGLETTGTEIFQLHKATVTLKPPVEVVELRYKELSQRVEDQERKVATLTEENSSLRSLEQRHGQGSGESGSPSKLIRNEGAAKEEVQVFYTRPEALTKILATAESSIDILTTNLESITSNYNSTLWKRATKGVHVRILTMNPNHSFTRDRVRDFVTDSYADEALKFKEKMLDALENCLYAKQVVDDARATPHGARAAPFEVRIHDRFPTKMIFRVDGHVILGFILHVMDPNPQKSLSRNNVHIQFDQSPNPIASVSHQFQEHFEVLWKTSTPVTRELLAQIKKTRIDESIVSKMTTVDFDRRPARLGK